MANDYSGKIRNEIQELKKRNAELEASAEHTKRYGYEVGQNQKRIEVYNKKLEEIRKNEEKINDLTADRIGLGKQINNLAQGFSGDLLKQLGAEKSINLLKEARKTKDKEVIKQSKDYAKLLDGVLKGEIDAEEVTRQKSKFTGEYLDLVKKIQSTLIRTPEFTKKAGIEKEAQDKIKAFQKSVTDITDMLSSPKAMGVAAVGLLVQQMGDFVSKAFEARQALGTTAVESARVAGNLKVAGLAAKAVGGSSEQAEAAVMSLVDEFGSVSVISAGVSKQLGLITGQFGLSGDNAGKLLKQMQAINGASIETNLNLIGSVGELARAEGVAPAKVLNDIAGDTETFAKFAKDGGKNIGAAAIQAAKLGLSMATVAGIAENLLDFETSIEKQMEASVLLGRQVNLDKARELALTGELDKLQKEVVKQVGSEAEFNAMNVVQRKALADSIGVSVADLGKLVAGEKTSAQIAEDQVKAQKKQADLQMIMMTSMAVMQGIQTVLLALEQAKVTAIGKNLAKTVASAGASLAKGVGSIFSGFGMIPFGLGIPLAIAAAAGMFALSRKAASEVPKAETGGMVTKSGLAEIHKGEAISGTKNQMGFGADMTETNRLLKQTLSESKQLREQNLQLMNRLTNKVGDLALSS